MTPSQETDRINRIIVEKGEGGCWHEPKYKGDWRGECLHCHRNYDYEEEPNPDFSKWENFGRLLKIAEKNGLKHSLPDLAYCIGKFDIDQIPWLCAKDLARIIKKEKK